jgi:hypothetical protein
MKTIACILVIIILYSCGDSHEYSDNAELISEAQRQDSIFNSLLLLTSNSIPEAVQQDSLGFLILPVQASCPSCRKKTIDSIVKHQNGLKNNRFIIISAIGGRKFINSFFREENAQLPVMENKLFLDSTNQAYKFSLYDEQPTIYYTYNRKALKKVVAVPRTVRKDLFEFFSCNMPEDKISKRN